MTKAITIGNVTVIWPELATDDDYEFEHAIVVTARADGGFSIQQLGAPEIEVPHYAVQALIRALRTAKGGGR
jgi:hypothetical protein